MDDINSLMNFTEERINVKLKEEQEMETQLANLYYSKESGSSQGKINITKAMQNYLDPRNVEKDIEEGRLEEKLEFISSYFRWTPFGVKQSLTQITQAKTAQEKLAAFGAAAAKANREKALEAGGFVRNIPGIGEVPLYVRFSADMDNLWPIAETYLRAARDIN